MGNSGEGRRWFRRSESASAAEPPAVDVHARLAMVGLRATPRPVGGTDAEVDDGWAADQEPVVEERAVPDPESLAPEAEAEAEAAQVAEVAAPEEAIEAEAVETVEPDAVEAEAEEAVEAEAAEPEMSLEPLERDPVDAQDERGDVATEAIPSELAVEADEPEADVAKAHALEAEVVEPDAVEDEVGLDAVEPVEAELTLEAQDEAAAPEEPEGSGWAAYGSLHVEQQAWEAVRADAAGQQRAPADETSPTDEPVEAPAPVAALHDSWRGEPAPWLLDDDVDAVAHDQSVSAEPDLAPDAGITSEDVFGSWGSEPDDALDLTGSDPSDESSPVIVADVEDPVDEPAPVDRFAQFAALAVDEPTAPEAEAEDEATSPRAWWGFRRRERKDAEPEPAAEAVAVVPEAREEPEPEGWWSSLRTEDETESEGQDAAAAVGDGAGDGLEVDVRDEQLSDDPDEVLARLARLRDAGLLTPIEYERERRALLADQAG